MNARAMTPKPGTIRKKAPGTAAPLDPERWVAAHGEVLFRYARRRVDDDAAAEDLVQETLLAAWRGREAFDGRASERTWLVAILRRKIVDHLRDAAAGARAESRLARWVEERFTEAGKWRQGPARWPRDQDSRHALGAAIVACIERLPAETAELFLLREQHDVPAERVAEQTGLSPNALAARLFRARTALRDCLDRTWLGERRR